MKLSRLCLGALALGLCLTSISQAEDPAEPTLKVEHAKIATGLGDRYALSAICDPKSHKIFAFGGERNGPGGFDFVADAMVLDYGAKKPAWTKLTVSGPNPGKRAYSPFAVNTKERKAYMFGGFKEGGEMTNDLWSFSAKDLKWEKLHDANVKGAPPGRDAQGLTVDEETGAVYLFGGLKGIQPMEAFNDLWKWEPKTKKWTEIKAKADDEWPCVRYFQSFTAIGGGKALLYGGNTSDVAPKGTEAHYFYELDLKTGAWKRLSHPSELRCYQDALWHPTLKRLIVLNGGYSAANDEVFAYDPANDAWEKCGNSGHAHTYGATVLDTVTGDIYTFGGLSEMSFMGKHAVDETHCVKISVAK